MKADLHLSDSLSLPLDACTQTFAWIGRKGSGKTYGAGKLTEELLDQHVQVVILDTVGNWYGLRLRADGDPGYSVPVFGGLRQDLPLLATAGEVVADVVVDSGRSVILDVSQFNFAERKRFAADFGTRLWQRKKGEAEPAPLHLVIEECQLIVPQFVGKDDTRMVHVYEEIIRLGRNYGIGVSMLTQRPQSVNKEVLTQAECIMAFQVNGVPERKALKDWLTYEGGDVNLVNDLPSLPVGTCYLWSPQWLRTFERIKVAKKWTLDASATPKMGAKIIRRELAPLDVKDIEARMVSTIEKAKAEDPKQLRMQLAEAKRVLESQRSTIVRLEQRQPAEKETVKEVPVLKGKQLAQLETFCTKLMREAERHGSAMSLFWSNLHQVAEALLKAIKSTIPERPTTMTRHDIFRRVQTPITEHARAVPRGHGTRVTNHSVGDPRRTAHLSGSAQRILNALMWAEGIGLREMDKTQLALMSDQRPTSGGYFNNLGMLRSAGLIVYPKPGTAQLTDAGRAQAEAVDVPSTSEELQAMLYAKLPASQVRILRVVIGCYPKPIGKEELAERAEQRATSGGYFNNLGRLRSLGLIEYPTPGQVVAQPVLFLEGR